MGANAATRAIIAGTLFTALVLAFALWRSHRVAALAPIRNDVEPPRAANSRPVYPYSVVPGGVRNSVELRSAVIRDPVVAQHYKGFQIDSATPIHLPVEKLAYVSYRVANKVYWSNHQVRLARGEPLLTDGSHLIRARCGNRVSFDLQPGDQPKTEPTEAEMDLIAENFSDSTSPQSWAQESQVESPLTDLSTGTADPAFTQAPKSSAAASAGGSGPGAGAGAAGGAGGGGGGSGAAVAAIAPERPATTPTAATPSTSPQQTGSPLGPLQIALFPTSNPAPGTPNLPFSGLAVIQSLPSWSTTPLTGTSPSSPPTTTGAPLNPVFYSWYSPISTPAPPGQPASPNPDPSPTPTPTPTGTTPLLPDQTQLVSTPEPGSRILAGLGLILLLAALRRYFRAPH